MGYTGYMKINYLLIPFVAFATAVLGNYYAADGMIWYAGLNLPGWTPSGGVIGAVWTVIFIFSALSALVVWNTMEFDGGALWIFALFLLNAALNVLWSVLFFKLNYLGPAVVEAATLCLTVLILILAIRPISAVASALLLPYAAWTAFATYLAYNVWTLNR